MRIPDRRSTRPGTTRRVRLAEFDYSTPGYYFVTICTYNRQHLFGTIDDDFMRYSQAGSMVMEVIDRSTDRFSSIQIDTFAIMPNHIHLLIGLAVRRDDNPGTDDLKDVIHWIKSSVHQRYRSGVRSKGWPPYKGRVWQEGYHDHIVRNDRELEALRSYTASNAEMWEKDRFYDGFQNW